MNPALKNYPLPVEMNVDGVMLVGKNRVTLDTVILTFKNGAAAEEIVFQYPVLKLADVYAMIGYYLNNQDEIDAYLVRRRKIAEQVYEKNMSRFNGIGIRDRLCARLSTAQKETQKLQ